MEKEGIIRHLSLEIYNQFKDPGSEIFLIFFSGVHLLKLAVLPQLISIYYSQWCTAFNFDESFFLICHMYPEMGSTDVCLSTQGNFTEHFIGKTMRKRKSLSNRNISVAFSVENEHDG